MNSKQNIITNNDLNILHTSGLQYILDSKQNNISNNTLNIEYVSGLQDKLDTKQNNIVNNDLEISYTSGLQNSLDSKQNVISNDDLNIAYVKELQDKLNSKQNNIQNNTLSISYTLGLQDKLNEKQNTITTNNLLISYTSGLQSSLDSKQNVISNDGLNINHISGLQPSLNSKQDNITDSSLFISHTVGLQDKLNEKAQILNTTLIGIPTAPTPSLNTNNSQIATTEFVNQRIEILIDNSSLSLDTLREIASSLNDDTDFAGTMTNALSKKQDIITDNDLNISHTAGLQLSLNSKQNLITDNDLKMCVVEGLEDALNSKQNKISDNGLNIIHIAGLQPVLDLKQDNIGVNGLEIGHITGLQTELNKNQNVIGKNDLEISFTLGLQSALDSKAPLLNPILFGIPKAPTPSLETSNTQIATTEFVNQRIETLIDSAPESLDTLKELAASLNDDSNFASTMTNALSQKQDKISDSGLNIMHISGLEQILDLKQDNIGINGLEIANINLLQNSLESKQDKISDNGLNIVNVFGLQDSLDLKQNNIGIDDLEIANINGLQTALNDNQTSISENDLEISYTAGLQEALNTKQNNIGVNGLEISNINGLQDEIDKNQNTIGEGDLEINYTNGLQTSLNLKAPLLNPILMGIPKAPTPSLETNNTQIATTEFVNHRIGTIIDNAPEALDTLKELSLALNDDANFASTMTSALSEKQDIINDNDLNIINTAGLQLALDGKQSKLTDDDLNITHISGLEQRLEDVSTTITINGVPVNAEQSISLTSTQWTTLGVNNDINLKDGRVGIGTITPICALDVVGTIKSTGDIIGNWEGNVVDTIYGGTGISLSGDNSGKILIGDNQGTFKMSNLTAGSNIIIENDSGTIKISSTFGLDDITTKINVENMNVLNNLEAPNLLLKAVSEIPNSNHGDIVRYETEIENDILYNNDGTWISLLESKSTIKLRKYETNYQKIIYNGNKINVNMGYSLSVLEIEDFLVDGDSIDLILDVNLTYNGMIKTIIAGPTLKHLFNTKYFRIISRFVNSTANGITSDGVININSTISLNESGNSINLLGLIHNNQPYWMIMNGNFDYDITIIDEDIIYSNPGYNIPDDNDNDSNNNDCNCREMFKYINNNQNHDLLYNNDGTWVSLITPEYNRIIKCDINYQNINYHGIELEINLSNSIVVLDLNVLTVSDNLIKLRLNVSLQNNGIMKRIICGPSIKHLFNNKYFQITSRFVDSSSQGISSTGTILNDNSILFNDSGNSIELMGLVYNNQPYWMIINGNYDFNI